MKPLLLTLTLLFVLTTASACFDSFRSIGTREPREGLGERPSGAESTDDVDAGTPASLDSPRDPVELEEQRMEDHAALTALIASKTETSTSATTTEPDDARTPADEVLLSPLGVPTAGENLKLNGAQCLARLRSLGVPYERPDFETPHIKTPVLLTGPIGTVRIGPKYIGNKRPTNAVMDCHLALALVEVARHAETLGITAIEFYSTYRPLKPPPKKCPKGKGRKKCLKRKKNYERTVREQKSQHRFGRAIDIRWFKTADERTIDVLEHFDRRSKSDPCSYTPSTPEARLLSRFACGLYRYRIFNVMLTPNANKAHHNHFHFDLTPGAGWYIIR